MRWSGSWYALVCGRPIGSFRRVSLPACSPQERVTTSNRCGHPVAQASLGQSRRGPGASSPGRRRLSPPHWPLDRRVHRRHERAAVPRPARRALRHHEPRVSQIAAACSARLNTTYLDNFTVTAEARPPACMAIESEPRASLTFRFSEGESCCRTIPVFADRRSSDGVRRLRGSAPVPVVV
jgi:hypothetical protein